MAIRGSTSAAHILRRHSVDQVHIAREQRATREAGLVTKRICTRSHGTAPPQ
jgi:hypothetical protein